MLFMVIETFRNQDAKAIYRRLRDRGRQMPDGLTFVSSWVQADAAHCHLEKLHNLEALPGDGFTIACFPVKIRGASAGWTRAVAIVDH